jgi:hypothetical protein
VNDFLLCFLCGSAGAIVGFIIANWARRLPRPLAYHQHCDERYVNMHRRLASEIRSRDAEIQRLMQGLS